MVTVEPLELCNVTELPGLKTHDEPPGVPVQDRVMGEPNSGCGVSETVYCAVAPASGTVWFSGAALILKSDIAADTEVCAKTMFPGAKARIVPPLNDTEFCALTDVGVAVIVKVAVDPACNEIGPQLIPVPVLPAPQVPVLMLPVMLVSGTPVAFMSARIVMLLARSGPLFVIV